MSEDITEALRQQLNGLYQILDQQYPERIEELSALVNMPAEQVRHALEYTCDQMRENKHALVNHILMFHRVLERSKE